ncbi:MAG: PQQ-binding-like beta-propeller repeat protein [Chloroflexota bacterium]|nr:PQQ-binding-like beta-propeller repeat protein [Chloroflexota bacterium]MDE2958798.1 PQQ-binding-like beta-propeller repeat protein [Chloroflexota bacterium]
MRRSSLYGETVIGKRWRFRDVRIWLAAAIIALALLALWAVRTYQITPLLFPPPTATSSANLSEAPTDWPSGRRDIGGAAFTEDSNPSPPFVTRWEVDLPGVALGAPAIVGDLIFVSTDGGEIVALEANSGDTRWKRHIGSPSDSAPAVAGDLVYIGTRDHRMIALDRHTGELRWENNLGNIVLGSPIVSNGTLYIGSTNGMLEALDAGTGEPRWSADANGWVVAHPATDGTVVAATSLGERFITVDPETGRRLLVFYSGTPVAGGPVIADGRAFFVTNRGAVWAVDPSAVSRPFSRFAYVTKINLFAWRLRSDPPRQTGTLWVGSARGRVKYSPAYAKGSLLVVNETGKVTAFAHYDGSILWEMQLDGEVIADPVVAGDTLVLTTADGALHGLNIDTGSKEWTHHIGDYPASAAPSVSGHTIFLPTTDGTLTALEGR